MTISRSVGNQRTSCALLIGLAGTVVFGSASAWQSTSPPPQPVRPVVISPPPAIRFQQVVQQQQARDRLQQSQLEQQLHQGVSRNADRSSATDPKAQQRRDQAAQAQLERDRARQRDLLDHYRQAPVLPRVVPKDLPAPDANNKGH